MSSSSAAVSAEDIAASPAWLPLDAAGTGAMRLVRLDEAAYRASSFLDQRLLAANPATSVVASATVTEAAARLQPHAHYIFHIGHVGSTLISRLIGEFAGVFSVREPMILREAAAQAAGIREATDLRGILSLLSRTWQPGQRAVVKATSFVGEIAASVLEIDSAAAAILMFTPAPAYLRCILAGPNSRREARVLAPARLARLRRRLGEATVGLDSRFEGHWIAMSWLCEMACLWQVAQRFASRVLWVDFDGFLAAPGAGLRAILSALGATVDPDSIDRILAGPLMHRYAKAPEHAYDAALRRQVLASADREHPVQIRHGMAWLEALGASHPQLSEVLSFSPKADE